ncbi:MAG: phosphate ABC transporter permease PstA [Methylococcaceae bacterium]
MMNKWFKSGKPWIWLNAAAVSVNMILVFGLLGLIANRGLQHFWPSSVASFTYQRGPSSHTTIIGEITDSEEVSAEQIKDAGGILPDDVITATQLLIKAGNRDLTGQDFKWILQNNIIEKQYPPEILTIERREWGNFYGYPIALKKNGKIISEDQKLMVALNRQLVTTQLLFDEIKQIEKNDIGTINYDLENLRIKKRKLTLEKRWNDKVAEQHATKKADYEQQYQTLQTRLAKLYQAIQKDSLVAKVADGRETEIPLSKIVHAYQPNKMSFWQKISLYSEKFVEFLVDEPREANTEGGIFPAIFGTVMMVIIMSIIVTPFGIVAAVYLREYANQGLVTRIIRIAVNNLAGVPSIVYGVFGLGFFVYFLGGNLDQLFFPERLPSPTFGTPGILWASLTLALLTLPVVIVATEEGLARIPSAIRQGSLALGATKAETLWRIVLPMASPAMMTGLILGVARAAGEVAPLMLVGVVKLAPSLPLDGNFPFLHLDRKFMHLGFHIYDVGFQSPNVEAARPLVFATAFLLVLVIIALNLTAVSVRNNLREKYQSLEN